MTNRCRNRRINKKNVGKRQHGLYMCDAPGPQTINNCRFVKYTPCKIYTLMQMHKTRISGWPQAHSCDMARANQQQNCISRTSIFVWPINSISENDIIFQPLPFAHAIQENHTLTARVQHEEERGLRYGKSYWITQPQGGGGEHRQCNVVTLDRQKHQEASQRTRRG